jgi:hypothetical protein
VTILDEDNRNKIHITDQTGKVWDITHALTNYGFKPENFQFGLGPFAIKPILEPKFFSPGDNEYPREDKPHLIIPLNLNRFIRVHALHIMKIFEVANDMYLETPVAV